MVTMAGKIWKVCFIDHTAQRIQKLLNQGGLDRHLDNGMQILGRHPGTICLLYSVPLEGHEQGKIEDTEWIFEKIGFSRLFTGNCCMPPDVYRKKEGHARSLNITLRGLDFDRDETRTFFKLWHGVGIATAGTEDNSDIPF